MLRALVFTLLITLLIPVYAQEKETFRIAFWNVENLFDTRNDSLKQDEEFLPTSLRGWHYGRYKKKLADVARVITAIGEWEPPALIGLCEVENDRVLQDLTRNSPLKTHGYRYLMTASGDLRGIDVALLYQRDKFKVIRHQSIRPGLGANERPTRDILHVTGLVPTLDTLDVFVVHFPSRSGGERASEPKRLKVAQLLRNTIDSLMLVRQEARIVIMGDFNDYPENKSIAEILAVRPLASQQHVNETFDRNTLYHLLSHRINKKGKSGESHKSENKGESINENKRKNRLVRGSYKYKGEWGLLDHLIVSGALLDRDTRFFTDQDKAEILSFPFLLIEDEKYGGWQPFRTYNGMKYQGGYSDHLPVRVDFELLFD